MWLILSLSTYSHKGIFHECLIIPSSQFMAHSHRVIQITKNSTHQNSKLAWTVFGLTRSTVNRPPVRAYMVPADIGVLAAPSFDAGLGLRSGSLVDLSKGTVEMLGAEDRSGGGQGGHAEKGCDGELHGVVDEFGVKSGKWQV